MTVTATEGDMFIGQFILFWQFNELCRQAYTVAQPCALCAGFASASVGCIVDNAQHTIMYESVVVMHPVTWTSSARRRGGGRP
jgi:hypothetical protein